LNFQTRSTRFKPTKIFVTKSSNRLASIFGDDFLFHSTEIKIDNEEMIVPNISNSSRDSSKPINENNDRKSNSRDVFAR
jgi:hypothetical protein